MRTQGIEDLKISNGPTGGRIHNLPSCSALPQATALQAPLMGWQSLAICEGSELVNYYYYYYYCCCLLTYLLTPWSRDLLEKLNGSQLVKKFLALYGTRRFIIAFTSARNLYLFLVSSIQSMSPHPIPEDPS
jgi:hypothetical protein